MRRSSTSSSESRGVPWAGLLAAVLVVLIDRVAFADLEHWQWILERIPVSDTMENGVATDRTVHAELRAQEAQRPHLMLVGNSRVRRGMINAILSKAALEGAGTVSKMAHGGVRPYELAAMLDECRDYAPDVLVTVITAFETHRPVQFFTHMGAGRARTWLDLLAQLDPAVIAAERHALLGLGLATQLDGYRFRRPLGSAGLDAWRRFPGLSRGSRPTYTDAPVALRGEEPLPLDINEAMALFKREMPDAPPVNMRRQIEQCNSVTRGPHAELQQLLLERALSRLAATGTDVLIVEAPIHPEAAALYRPEVRAENQAWIRRLTEHPQIHWLSQAECEPFPEDRWSDLTHLNLEGSQRLSNVTAQRVRRILAERDARP